ncbi:MAG: branched-chain amino acid ABC transporter permease, partial [bacterium]|nr:branched-chain amino acid ABC transporter permease [bacterium]
GVGLPTRSTVTKFKLPRATRPSHPKRMTLIWGLVAAVLIIFLPYDWRSAITVSLAAMIVAASLYVLVGLAGQISLMQMAIVAMASLAMTRLAGDWGIPFPISPILAVLAATLFGVITGLFAFRLRGVELAVLTLAAAGAFADVILNNQEFVRPIDMGQSIPAPAIFGLDIGPASTFPFGAGGTPSAWFGLFVLVVAIGCLSAAMWLRNNKLGLRFLAMRSNERAATALGVDLRVNKMTAIAISSAMAGVAGVVAGYTFGGLSASQYTAFASLAIVAAAFLGGISMISGSMVAGLAATGGFFTITMNHVFHYGEVEIAVAAFFLILVAVQQPEGIAGFNEQAYYHLRDKVRAKMAARRNPSPTQTPPPSVPVTASAGAPPD